MLVLVGTLIVGLFAVDLILDKSGCGSIDPTDPANYSSVQILNDTRDPVKVDRCHGAYCALPDAPTTVAPGHRTTVDGACGTTGADMTSYRLADINGHVIGYLAIATPRSTNNLTYRVTQTSADRIHPTLPTGATQ